MPGASPTWARRRPRFALARVSGRSMEPTLRDGDLAGQIVMTLAAGITLAGPPPAELLPDIPPHVLRDSFVSDCRWALELRDEIPVYAVLNPCRTYAYLRRGLLLSKAETGRIALELFPAEFHPLIRQAHGVNRGCHRGHINTSLLVVRKRTDHYSARQNRYLAPTRAPGAVALRPKSGYRPSAASDRRQPDRAQDSRHIQLKELPLDHDGDDLREFCYTLGLIVYLTRDLYDHPLHHRAYRRSRR